MQMQYQTREASNSAAVHDSGLGQWHQGTASVCVVRCISSNVSHVSHRGFYTSTTAACNCVFSAPPRTSPKSRFPSYGTVTLLICRHMMT